MIELEFPKELKIRLETLALKQSLQEIQQAQKELSSLYRERKFQGVFKTDLHRLAYLLTRMPATFAAVVTVMKELKRRGGTLTSINDLGAGCGTSYWALKTVFPDVGLLRFYEQDKAMITLGKYLMEDNPKVQWNHNDIRTMALEKAHITLLSYSFGEFEEKEQNIILKKSWDVSSEGVIVIEPGTPKGYEGVLLAREWVIKNGGYILAPCPHDSGCPLKKPDWCHFSVKLPRSANHRFLKSGSLAVEEEKFSYVIAMKTKKDHSEMRVIKPPRRRSGHVLLDLCTQDGIKHKTFSKKEGVLYRQARDIAWGDTLPYDGSKE